MTLPIGLVTDAWARGWRATPLEGTSQRRYDLIPANYARRAVALDWGEHRLRVEYAPPAVCAGALVSAAPWSAWIIALFLCALRRRRTRA